MAPAVYTLIRRTPYTPHDLCDILITCKHVAYCTHSMYIYSVTCMSTRLIAKHITIAKHSALNARSYCIIVLY